MNDHQLLRAYSQGDEEAFETLVVKYFRLISTVAARQTGDAHLAEEIAQSVFLILSRKAQGFSPKSSVAGWLLRTTRFVCGDALKMRRRREENERKLAKMLDHPLDSQLSPSTTEMLLEEAIRALRPEEQAGILAHFFEGKDFEELADMFAISEHAARKRTSRCLAKMQRFMSRRGAKLALPALSTLLLAQPAQGASTQSLQATMNVLHSAWQGSGAAGNAVSRADRIERQLRRNAWGRLNTELVLPLLLVLFSAWGFWHWYASAPARIERLGRAWGALDQQVATHTQFLMRTPPDTPNYQATVQQQLTAISHASSRIISRLNPLLVPPAERQRLAIFLTAELTQTLRLERSQQKTLLSYIRTRLGQGATFREAMKAVAAATSSESGEIKAMLSPRQRQVFDQIYGAEGGLLFSYPKAVALGQIGP